LLDSTIAHLTEEFNLMAELTHRAATTPAKTAHFTTFTLLEAEDVTVLVVESVEQVGAVGESNSSKQWLSSSSSSSSSSVTLITDFPPTTPLLPAHKSVTATPIAPFPLTDTNTITTTTHRTAAAFLIGDIPGPHDLLTEEEDGAIPMAAHTEETPVCKQRRRKGGGEEIVTSLGECQQCHLRAPLHSVGDESPECGTNQNVQ